MSLKTIDTRHDNRVAGKYPLFYNYLCFMSFLEIIKNLGIDFSGGLQFQIETMLFGVL